MRAGPQSWPFAAPASGLARAIRPSENIVATALARRIAAVVRKARADSVCHDVYLSEARVKSTKPCPALGTALAFALFARGAPAVEPVNFEIRYNADLVAVCATPPSDPNYLAAIHFCHGFGVGFARYHDALKEGKEFRPLFCFPDGLTRTKALDAYVRYSQAHPEYDRSAVGDVMTKFLIETYPCATGTR